MTFHLLAEGPRQLSTARYRSYNRFDQMAHAGMRPTIREGFKGARFWQDFPGKVAIVQRLPYQRNTAVVFGRIKRVAEAVGYDIDDMLFDPKALPKHCTVTHMECAQYSKAIAWSDFVTCSTPALRAEILARWPDKPVLVLPNVLGRLICGAVTGANVAPRQAETVTLGYTSATHAHVEDFRLIEPVLDRLLERYHHLRLAVVGTLEIQSEFEQKWMARDRLTRWPFITFDALPFLIHGVFDINLVPLMDIPFNRCKSLVKWLEAAIVGVPSVCSRIGEFKALPEGTAYSADTPDEWEYFLKRLIEDVDDRHHVGATARKHALGHYTYRNSKPLEVLASL